MTRNDSLRSVLETGLFELPHSAEGTLAAAESIHIDASEWAIAAQLAHADEWRWTGVWGDQLDDGFALFSCFAKQGAYAVVQTHLSLNNPKLPSQAYVYPAASRLERHTHDLLGIDFDASPDARRWIRHQAWDAQTFPLRRDEPLAGHPPKRTAADRDYPFATIAGSGVYEIPVGPVHAGIIEPGHFRFQAVGERVLQLEERLGYVHRGVEKLAVGRDVDGLLRLAARVVGDSTIAHSWAACRALEQAWGITPPVRASQLRGLLAERERIANHLGDIGAICNDVGFAFAQTHCGRLREQWQRRNAELFGHRLLMDCLCPGGVNVDLDSAGVTALREDHQAIKNEIERLFKLLNDQPGLEDRLLTTGYLSPESATALGCTGYVGKASNQVFDVRIQAPYPPYDALPIAAAVNRNGDVAARVQIRMDEIFNSLAWMDRLLNNLHAGPCELATFPPARAGEGLGIVEGWRGETLCYLRIDDAGNVQRYFPKDPSWHSWPALERIVLNNIVPDFPVCNKSVNGAYSGHDL